MKRTILGLLALAAALLPFEVSSQISSDSIRSGGQVVASSFRAATWANKPAAGIAGQIFRCTDCGTKGSTWADDGTRWKPLNGCATLATLDTASSNIANTDTLVFSYAMPAAFLQVSDRLQLLVTLAKSGTTDTSLMNVRLGTAGTTADTAIAAITSALGATNRSGGYIVDFRVASATTVQRLVNGSPSTAFGYSNVTGSALAGAVTVTNVSNALTLSISISSSSTNDTTQLIDASLKLCSTAN